MKTIQRATVTKFQKFYVADFLISFGQIMCGVVDIIYISSVYYNFLSKIKIIMLA